jgi:exonuclease SbcD
VQFFSDREIERLAFVRDGEEVCALYGRSFRTTAETENLAKGFKRAKRDRLAIGVLHTNVGGRTDYEPYAPCTIEDLRAAKMDYWALGHIHKPEVLSESPHIAYAGCTQGLDPSESGVRGCSVVTLADGGATVEFVPTASILWDRASVPCDSAEDVDDVRALVLDAVASSRRDSDSRPVVLRVEIGGRSVAHAMLARSGALRDLLADVRAEALERDPWVWIDRIADRTRPAIDLEAVREGHDFAGDLVRRADAVLAEDRETLAYIQSIGRVAFDALDARDVPDIDAASIVERARDLALDHLLAEEER